MVFSEAKSSRRIRKEAPTWTSKWALVAFARTSF